MTLDDIIQKRRSIRRYENRSIDRAMLMQVLDAGRLAPSARNAQTWHFTAVENQDLRAQLVPACNNQAMIGEAPVSLVVWSRGERTMGCGQSTASVDCSIALSFMMLKATELGLGTCWLGAFDARAVKSALSLPEDAVVVAVSPMGWPAERPEPRPRKMIDEVVDIIE